MGKSNFIIVAIDGGAAAGKSSTARALSERFNLMHADTGSYYRALTAEMLRRRVNPGDLAAVAAFQGELTVDLQALEVRAGGTAFPIQCEAWGRAALLEGLDEIETTLRRLPAIEAFEARRTAGAGWL